LVAALYDVVVNVFRWWQISLKQTYHGIPGLSNSDPLHCKRKQEKSLTQNTQLIDLNTENLSMLSGW